jgi:hypothetical protein
MAVKAVGPDHRRRTDLMTTSRYDLTIDELLSDPVTRAVMKADRVDPSELETMLRALAPRFERAASRSIRDLCASAVSNVRSQLCGAGAA